MTISNRLAKSETQPKLTPQELCDVSNAKLGRRDIEWAVFDDRLIIRWKQHPVAMLREDRLRKPVMDRRGQPMSESDTFALNLELEKLGATKRYRPDGTKYDAGAEA